MIRDEYGNINVLVAWYAWDEERGGLLTDTIMLASYNPTEQLVTFLSVPRDLYVNYENGSAWRVNGLYWSHYLANNDSHDAWSEALRGKVAEITGVSIPYSFVVDFSWFVDLVDSVDGITIDVPERIYDDAYPGPNDTYETFIVEAW
jgi:anionic cell wall polymer biosynthesis LytR-Cps2A-Psr (LCP) family protein